MLGTRVLGDHGPEIGVCVVIFFLIACRRRLRRRGRCSSWRSRSRSEGLGQTIHPHSEVALDLAYKEKEVSPNSHPEEGERLTRKFSPATHRMLTIAYLGKLGVGPLCGSCFRIDEEDLKRASTSSCIECEHSDDQQIVEASDFVDDRTKVRSAGVRHNVDLFGLARGSNGVDRIDAVLHGRELLQ